MTTPDQAFEIYAKGLVPSQTRVDPETLRKAQEWYKTFVGSHAVNMADRDLVEIYLDLN